MALNVLGVARDNHLKTQVGSGRERGEDRFRILVEHGDGSQSIEKADIVVDATGVFGQANWCGAGGLPARGERRLRWRIEYAIPDVLGSQREAYEARRILVVGNGLAAAATIVALSKLMQRVPQTDVTWVTPVATTTLESGPIDVSRFAGLPPRRQLAEAANALAASTKLRLAHRPGLRLEAVDYDAADQQLLVTFDGEPEPLRVDRIVANVGHRPDRSIYEELQVRECPRTGGPWGVSQSLEQHPAAAPPDPGEHPAERLITTEPNFYILGAKSFGRDPSFLMTDGLAQVRDLFVLIGGRASLDLYSTAEKPVS